MKRFLGVMLVLLSLVTLVSAASAQDSYFLGSPTALNWRINGGSATTGAVDSTYKTLSMVGSTAVPDTTNAIDTEGWAWGAVLPQTGSITTGAMLTIGRLWVVTCASNLAAGNDTLFVAIDSSPDKTNWNSGAYVGYGQGVTAGTDAALTAPIVLAPSATTAGSVVPSAFSRYIRFRIRPDGNTSAVFPCSRFYYAALKSRMSQ